MNDIVFSELTTPTYWLLIIALLFITMYSNAAYLEMKKNKKLNNVFIFMYVVLLIRDIVRLVVTTNSSTTTLPLFLIISSIPIALLALRTIISCNEDIYKRIIKKPVKVIIYTIMIIYIFLYAFLYFKN